MTSKELSKGILRTIAILALIALAIFLFYQLSTLFIYFLISVLFTLLGNPVVRFLQQKLKFKICYNINMCKRKTSSCEADICFSCTISERISCEAGCRVR